MWAPVPYKRAPVLRAGRLSLRAMMTRRTSVSSVQSLETDWTQELDLHHFRKKMKSIAQKFVNELNASLTDKGVQLELTPAAITYPRP